MGIAGPQAKQGVKGRGACLVLLLLLLAADEERVQVWCPRDRTIRVSEAPIAQRCGGGSGGKGRKGEEGFECGDDLVLQSRVGGGKGESGRREEAAGGGGAQRGGERSWEKLREGVAQRAMQREQTKGKALTTALTAHPRRVESAGHIEQRGECLRLVAHARIRQGRE